MVVPGPFRVTSIHVSLKKEDDLGLFKFPTIQSHLDASTFIIISIPLFLDKFTTVPSLLAQIFKLTLSLLFQPF